MDNNLRDRLEIDQARLDEINALLLDPRSRVINDFLAVVDKYGTVEEINRKAHEARQLPNLMARLKAIQLPLPGRPGMADRAARPEGVHLRRRLPAQGAGRAGRPHDLRRPPGRHAGDQRLPVLPLAHQRGQAGHRAAAS